MTLKMAAHMAGRRGIRWRMNHTGTARRTEENDTLRFNLWAKVILALIQ